MTTENWWILPDGIEELLPPDAQQLEHLRRRILDVYHSWGYDLVIPPTLEFLDSLLTGVGEDLDRKTLKVTDQVSGKMLGLRADISPQVARIDAHSLRQPGPARFCYAGTTLVARPPSQAESRAPIQIGAELYGEASIDADIEVINLMLSSLQTAGVKNLTLDIGHIGIFSAIESMVKAEIGHSDGLFELVQRKMLPDLEQWVAQAGCSSELSSALRVLPRLAGGIDVLQESLARLPRHQSITSAIDALESIAQRVLQAHPDLLLHFDLGEIYANRYHTGLVFAAYVPDCGSAIANGGRYDKVGQAFGRARPATGFSADLRALLRYGTSNYEPSQSVYVPRMLQRKSAETIEALRAKGYRVILGLKDDHSDLGDSDYVLEQVEEGFELSKTQ